MVNHLIYFISFIFQFTDENFATTYFEYTLHEFNVRSRF